MLNAEKKPILAARARCNLMLEKHMIDFTSSKAARDHFHTFKQY